MQKKFLMLITSLTLVMSVYFVSGRVVEAGCICVKDEGADYINKCSNPANAGTSIYDSTGELIAPEACGIWRSTPYTVASGGVATYTDAEEPTCPKSGKTPYGKAVRSNPIEDWQCNVYTQTYFQSPFKIPTLGDLLGNIIRLFFFIAGIYAMVLLLLGGFEWVSSGGDDKKLTGARQKILNAIIGLVIMVAVLTLVIVMEQVVFGGKVCLGISCPINLSGIQLVGR